MKAPALRAGSLVLLACWLASASLGHLLWVHVEIEHHGHDHACTAGSDRVEMAAVHLGDHGHQLSARTALPGSTPRLQVAAPAVIFVLSAEPSPSSQPVPPSTAGPHPRGSPQRHTILQI
jgi:hypothetical protein